MNDPTEVAEPEVKDAPPPVEGGQADGSPLPDDQRPTDAPDAGTANGDEQVLELRRKLTEIGEDRKKALSFVQKMLADPTLGPAAQALLDGREPAEDRAEVDEERSLLTELAGEGNESKLARLLELREKRLKGEVTSTIQPLARRVVQGHQSQVLVDAIEEAGLDPKVARTPEFKAFQRTYETQNESWYPEARNRAPAEMASLLVAEFKAKGKRPTRDPAEAREASLNRGGGGGTRAPGAGEEVEYFNPRAADAFQKIQDIHQRGKKAVAREV